MPAGFSCVVSTKGPDKAILDFFSCSRSPMVSTALEALSSLPGWVFVLCHSFDRELNLQTGWTDVCHSCPVTGNAAANTKMHFQALPQNAGSRQSKEWVGGPAVSFGKGQAWCCCSLPLPSWVQRESEGTLSPGSCRHLLFDESAFLSCIPSYPAALAPERPPPPGVQQILSLWAISRKPCRHV